VKSCISERMKLKCRIQLGKQSQGEVLTYKDQGLNVSNGICFGLDLLIHTICV